MWDSGGSNRDVALSPLAFSGSAPPRSVTHEIVAAGASKLVERPRGRNLELHTYLVPFPPLLPPPKILPLNCAFYLLDYGKSVNLFQVPREKVKSKWLAFQLITVSAASSAF